MISKGVTCQPELVVRMRRAEIFSEDQLKRALTRCRHWQSCAAPELGDIA